MAYATIEKLENNIALIKLNRPEALNALSIAVLDDLEKVVEY